MEHQPVCLRRNRRTTRLPDTEETTSSIIHFPTIRLSFTYAFMLSFTFRPLSSSPTITLFLSSLYVSLQYFHLHLPIEFYIFFGKGRGARLSSTSIHQQVYPLTQFVSSVSSVLSIITIKFLHHLSTLCYASSTHQSVIKFINIISFDASNPSRLDPSLEKAECRI